MALEYASWLLIRACEAFSEASPDALITDAMPRWYPSAAVEALL
jgi:hypothetical protein